MVRMRYISFCFIVSSVAIVAACSKKEAAASSVAPAAPTMPTHWQVTSDISFPTGQIKPIAERLGGDMTALRNTVYDVNGKRVQLNTLVATDAANADRIMVSLREIKSDIALLRRGLIIYEFVGKNDVLPDIRAGKAHIEAGGEGN